MLRIAWMAEKISKFFGHVVRRNSLEKLTLEGTVACKRSLGRSPTRYIDLIVNVTGKTLTHSYRMAESREEWKSLTVDNS